MFFHKMFKKRLEKTVFEVWKNYFSGVSVWAPKIYTLDSIQFVNRMLYTKECKIVKTILHYLASKVMSLGWELRFAFVREPDTPDTRDT